MQTKLIFSPGDFPANHSALPENEKAQMMNATCGMKCYEQYVKLNPNGSSRKMSLVLSTLTAEWFSSRCALTWKMKGTKFNRLLFQLRPKTHHTAGIDAGLLPTVTAMDSTNATATMKSTQVKEGSMHSVTLNRALSMGILPTPNSRDWKDNIGNGKDAPSIGVTRGYSLGQKVNSLLPTPCANDSPEKNTGTRNQDSIAKIAKEMTGTTSQLNPRFVAEMMGFPPNWTELPFLNGETKA